MFYDTTLTISHSLFITCAWSMLLSFLEIYGLGEVGTVIKVLLLLLVGKDIVDVLQNSSNFLGCRNGILPPSLYRFRLEHLVQ